ncbi:MAG: hypothetical protein H7061_01710 [Bdellovibrionaceae bacterium]|nr:hypothetical protein [Bdellovibrio sp.]
MIFRAIYLLILALSFSFTAYASGQQCKSIFVDHSPFTEIPANLAQVHETEKETLSLKEIKTRNRATLKKLENYIPSTDGVGASAVPYKQLVKIQNMLGDHPIVGKDGVEKYDDVNERGPRIGYCFGRSTFVHLVLKMMGLQNESVLKIWAVGKMTSSEGGWQFHVATVAFTSELGWMVVDNYFPQPVSLKKWSTFFAGENHDGMMRFYITPAEKFNLRSGAYPRVDLGLDLPACVDCYKNYFVDMLRWLRGRSVRSMGLSKLTGPSLADDTVDIPAEWGLFKKKKKIKF